MTLRRKYSSTLSRRAKVFFKRDARMSKILVGLRTSLCGRHNLPPWLKNSYLICHKIVNTRPHVPIRSGGPVKFSLSMATLLTTNTRYCLAVYYPHSLCSPYLKVSEFELEVCIMIFCSDTRPILTWFQPGYNKKIWSFKVGLQFLTWISGTMGSLYYGIE